MDAYAMADYFNHCMRAPQARVLRERTGLLIDAYFSANMDLLKSQPPFDLYRQDWPVHTAQVAAPPARILRIKELESVSPVSGRKYAESALDYLRIVDGVVCRR